MQSEDSGIKTDEKENNLEVYLNDVFQKECVFGISQKEVEFIQIGIEYLVEQIVGYVLDDLHRSTENGELCPAMPLLDCPHILKVGSFYEGTKNHFPSEFDFIFCFYKQISSNIITFPYFQPPIEKFVERVCRKHQNTLKYSNSSVKDAGKLHLKKYREAHGPASWLCFKYTSVSGKEHEINVDVVPASKIYLDPDRHCKDLDSICELKPFLQEIWLTQSILVVKNNYSFTETEVEFMKNTLSENHVKVYRILKFLINGHGDDEKYSGAKEFGTGYSSYKIKTLIISHHYKCQNKDSSEIGCCILKVLEEMSLCDDDLFPRLVMAEKLVDFLPCLYLKDDLKSLTSRLKAMQKMTGDYNYERDRIKQSLPKQHYDNQRHENEQGDSCCIF